MCLKTLLGRENYQYFDKVLIHLARQLVACRWKNCTVHRAFHFVPHVVDQDHSWEQLSLLYFCKIELFPETDVYIIKVMIINKGNDNKRYKGNDNKRSGWRTIG